jgi:hypothetical protein
VAKLNLVDFDRATTEAIGRLSWEGQAGVFPKLASGRVLQDAAPFADLLHCARGAVVFAALV